MRKFDVNGAILVPILFLSYVGIAIALLQTLGRQANIAEGIDAVDIEALGRLNLTSIALIGGAGVLATFLYFVESRFERPAPQWIYLVLPLLMMGTIYVLTPSPTG